MASAARGVRILPVRVLGKCGGFDSDIIAGMRWAAGLSVPGVPTNPYPARVLNLSLGGDGPCSAAYQEAVDQITAAGTVIVAAAGNSAGHAVGYAGQLPRRHRRGRACATSAPRSASPSLGPEVGISAPGGNCVNTATTSPCLYPILTTTNSGTTPCRPASTYTDSFNISVGTSFSTPLVAGVAALALSAAPTLTPAQVKQLLQRTARPFPSLGSIASSSTAASMHPAAIHPHRRADRPARVLLHHHDLRRGHARCGGRPDGGRGEQEEMTLSSECSHLHDGVLDACPAETCGDPRVRLRRLRTDGAHAGRGRRDHRERPRPRLPEPPRQSATLDGATDVPGRSTRNAPNLLLCAPSLTEKRGMEDEATAMPRRTRGAR